MGTSARFSTNAAQTAGKNQTVGKKVILMAQQQQSQANQSQQQGGSASAPQQQQQGQSPAPIIRDWASI